MAIRKPASTPVARPSKARKVDTTKPKCDIVKTAVLASPHLPASAATMIAGMSAAALTTYKSSRHDYQTDMVNTIGDVLRETEAEMQKSIAEMEEKSGQAVANKASRVEAVTKAQESLVSKKETASGSQAAVAAATKALEAAQTARKSAESNQRGAEKKLRSHAEKKKQLVDFQVGTLVPLKDGTPDSVNIDMKRVRKDIIELGKDFKLEQVLVETSAGALQAKKDARGSFQEVALVQLDQMITKRIGEVDEQITQNETAISEAASTISGAKDHETKCQGELEARENEQMVAKHEVNVAKKEFAAAESALASWIPDMRHLMDSLDKTKAKLSELQVGPLAAFRELEALEQSAADYVSTGSDGISAQADVAA